MESSSDLEGNTKVRRRESKHKPPTKTSGIGSGSSFAKAAPIVKNFDTKIIKLTAVALRSNGNSLSSYNVAI